MVRVFVSLLAGIFFSVIASSSALAAASATVNDVAANITNSASSLPGLLTGLAYLSGILIAVNGLFKVIAHVSNPNQTPIREPIIRFLVGGALFSLPIIVEAAVTTINGGTVGSFTGDQSVMNQIGGLLGLTTAILSLGTNFNSLLINLTLTTDQIPALIAAVAYLLGLLMSVSALYKIRDHVDDPNRMPLKDSVIRLLVAGALFALPTVFTAMYETVAGSGLGFTGTITSVVAALSFTWSSEDGGPQCASAILTFLPGSGGVGSVICNAWLNASMLPTFLSMLSYVIGMIFGVWGIIKIRDHVTNPSQTSLWDGVSRLVAGGAFFALPTVSMVMKASFLSPTLALFATATSNTGFAADAALTVTCASTTTTRGLDQAMGCLMQEILGPTQVALSFFCFVAGMIFIMIGISRLVKTAQEGARGPGGLGTVTTFVIGGILLSAMTIIHSLSETLFGSTQTRTYASLSYTSGMSSTETQAVYTVISAVLKFLIVIGLVSFVRGLFIIRDVAEGKGQASTMAGLTHIIGGALAVNLGPVLNAIQTSLGITAFGVAFTGGGP